MAKIAVHCACLAKFVHLIVNLNLSQTVLASDTECRVR